MEKLAINGGKPVRTKPFPSVDKGRFGTGELKLLKEVLKSGLLNVNVGTKVHEFEKNFADYMNMRYGVMVTSGTAAIHIALGAVNINPGDEVITSPITDMGTIVPILYQNAIPIFADINPGTFNMEPKSIEKRITNKTRVILVVHLAGNPVDMDPIMKLAGKHELYVIEDVCQSYDAQYKGKKCGTIGDIGCFSLNQYKHITCGDGGIAITNNDNLARRLRLFSDKAWPRQGDGKRDHLFLAPNYRVTELQAAVAIAQLKKLPRIIKIRQDRAKQLTGMIKDINVIETPQTVRGGVHTYFFYTIRINGKIMKYFVDALNAEGIPAVPGYLPKPVYLYDVLRLKKTYGNTHCPYDCKYTKNKVEYKKGLCPNAEQALKEMVRFSINECYTEKDIDDIARAIIKVSNAMVVSKIK